MIGQFELIAVMFIILLLFGGKKLPELARSMGTAVREYSSATKEPGKYVESKTKTKEDEETSDEVEDEETEDKEEKDETPLSRSERRAQRTSEILKG